MRTPLLLFISSLGTGGAERQMTKLIELLNEDSIVPDVLTYCNITDDYPSSAKMKRHNISTSNKILRNICLLWSLIKLRPKVILSYCADPNLLACFYKLINPKCKVIVSERNIVIMPLSKRKQFLYRLYNKVDLIISNARSQYEFLRKHYPKLTNKLVVIRNYTEIPKVANTHEYCAGPVIISVFSRYHPQKNTLGFLEALSLLKDDPDCPDFICRWYGNNSYNGELLPYYIKCKELIEHLGLSNVELCGFTDNPTQKMMESDVICLPSFIEGFSNSLSEALCAGKPILASAVSDNTDFVQNGENGYLFDPTNIKDISEKIKLFLLNKEKYSAMCAKSRAIAASLFDKERFVSSYKDILFN